MKSLITFFFLSFFVSSYAQSNEADLFAQAETAEHVLFGPEYLDYRRIAKTKFRVYQDLKDSTTYYYPFDTSKLYTSRNIYSLEDGIYDHSGIDSSFFDQNNEWILLKRYEKNPTGVFELKSIQKRRYQKNVADTLETEKFDTLAVAWNKTSRTFYEWFSSGDIKKVLFEKWNKEMSEWEFSFSILYNEANQTLGFKSPYTWTIYEWDTMGRPISKLRKGIDIASGTYVDKELTEYKWINNTVQWGLSYDWEVTLSDWVYKRKIVRSYNSAGLVDQELTLDSIGVNDYANKSKSIFTYDENGHEILVINYTWSVSEWKLTGKGVFGYDSEEHLILRSSYSWDSELNDLTLRREDRYYFEAYENGLVSIDDLNKVAVKLYPNPATEFVRFELEQLESKFNITIYSSMGRSVLAQKGSNGANIDISQLAAGQYFYILKGDGFGASGSFLKE